jgi:hypothetical protein
LENVSDDEDINRAWESIKENIKTSTTESLGLHEVEKHKPWFDEEWLGILYLRTFVIDLCYLHGWLEIKWRHFHLASVLFRFELQQVISAIVSPCVVDLFIYFT